MELGESHSYDIAVRPPMDESGAVVPGYGVEEDEEEKPKKKKTRRLGEKDIDDEEDFDKDSKKSKKAAAAVKKIKIKKIAIRRYVVRVSRSSFLFLSASS